MRSANYYINELNQSQEELDMVYQTINNFKIPYKYFKKLNILPLDIVEGEIDKYFDITTLLLENYQEAKQIDCSLNCLYHSNYSMPQELEDNFNKYHNDLPKYLTHNSTLVECIIVNYKKYKEVNVITPSVDIKIRERLDNNINNIILRRTKNIKFNTQKLIEAEERELNNKKYKIPVRRFPIDSRLLITDYPNDYYNDIIIVKICKKIIKYQNQYNPVVRQIKITELEDYLDYTDYKLVDRFDRQKRYCLDDDDNIYLGH
tara:strand:+ start:104 stop:886 length:783 start_codon:yes stop_codon:yes gene_type:complete